MRITKIIDGVSYDVDRYSFKPMAVVDSKEILRIDNLSKEGSATTDLTVEYTITQILLSEIYFELTIPASNVAFEGNGEAEPVYTTKDKNNYFLTIT